MLSRCIEHRFEPFRDMFDDSLPKPAKEPVSSLRRALKQMDPKAPQRPSSGHRQREVSCHVLSWFELINRAHACAST